MLCPALISDTRVHGDNEMVVVLCHRGWGGLFHGNRLSEQALQQARVTRAGPRSGPGRETETAQITQREITQRT